MQPITYILMKIFLMALVVSSSSAQAKTLFDFISPSIDGQPVNFSKYKAKAFLIVNTASKCGYTSRKVFTQFRRKIGEALCFKDQAGIQANKTGDLRPPRQIAQHKDEDISPFPDSV